MKHWQIPRRTFLRGAGISLSLPLLDIMAAPAKRIVRTGFLYYPNGVPEGTFGSRRDPATDRIVELAPSLQPLAPVMNKIILPRRLWTPRGNGHGQGTATWLTGGEYDEHKLDAGGVSVDQQIAQHFEGTTRLPSLELSVKGEGYFSKDVTRNNVSWRKRNLPCTREIEPRGVFDRLFRTANHPLSSPSILDQIHGQAKALQRRGSAVDRNKIGEYLDAVRSIEKQIEFSDRQTKTMVQNKALTDSLTRPQAGIPTDHQAYLRQMCDLMALAFWTDATRVSTFMLDHGQSNRYFNFIDGVQGTWHALSHWKDFSGKTEDDDGKTRWKSKGSKRDMYSRVCSWHHAQFAYLIQKLDGIPDQGGSLLDNCQLLYGSNISDGDEHAEFDLPIILAGGAGGKWKTGKVIPASRHVSMSKVHLAMLRNAGTPAARFAETSSPLAELV